MARMQLTPAHYAMGAAKILKISSGAPDRLQNNRPKPGMLQANQFADGPWPP